MKKLAVLLICLSSVFISLTVFAQNHEEKVQINAIKCFENESKNLGRLINEKDIRQLVTDFKNTRSLIKWLSKKNIKEYIEPLKFRNAYSFCIVAELMKRVGDYEAEKYYKKAIEADEDEPAYEVFYADYLRNFRGAQHPLFPEAEKHYLSAWRKYKQSKTQDTEIKKRIERGFVSLYQEDGLTLLHRSSNNDLKSPFIFFSTINKYAESTTDFDEVDDSRNFTSEALFAASATRLNRDLSDKELKNIIRKKEQFETMNRLRVRYGHLPVFDIFYKYRDIKDAQITHFFAPNEFNDVTLDEYGIAIEKPLNVSPNFDLFLRGTYKRINREGIIEFLPENEEEIDHFEAEAAISRFFGPKKANLEFVYVYQDIDPDMPSPPDRDRQIFAATLSLSKPNYETLFDNRGLEFFGGVVFDIDSFDSVDIKKNDYFVGASIKGIEVTTKNTLDVTIQPAIFTSEVDNDKSQDNSQYRTNVTLLYRLIDEEMEPGIPEKKLGLYPAFLHIVIPFSHDVAIDGLDDFENYKVGIELASKFFVKADHNTKFIGSTFLASIRYDYQDFFNLDKKLDLFSFNLSMGF